MNDHQIEASFDVVDQDSIVELGDAVAQIVYEGDCDCGEEC